jgi:hypothetical protein
MQNKIKVLHMTFWCRILLEILQLDDGEEFGKLTLIIWV